MKCLFCFIVFAISLISCVFAQKQQTTKYSIIVEYEYYRVPDTSPFIIRYNAILTSTDSISVFEIQLSNSDSLTTIQNSSGNYTMLNSKTNSIYFKDLRRNLLLNKESILIKKLLVADSLTIFDWQIVGPAKNVLGYDCLEASTYFRGRKYRAFFTTSIPLQNGPWKFHGLPGLILAVESEDKSFRITAKALKLSKQKVHINYPFGSERFVTRGEFESLYRRKYEEVTRYRGENGETMSMQKGLIEKIVE